MLSTLSEMFLHKNPFCRLIINQAKTCDRGKSSRSAASLAAVPRKRTPTHFLFLDVLEDIVLLILDYSGAIDYSSAVDPHLGMRNRSSCRFFLLVVA